MFITTDPLDLRSGGGFSFRFRTLSPRGLIAFARGSPQSVSFMAFEIFDGILYFVYDFGTYSSRKQMTDERMDNGDWHDVGVKIDGNRMILTLNEQDMITPLPQSEILKIYFDRLYVGSFDNFERIPWPIYSRRGYKGCIESLKINDIGNVPFLLIFG